MTARRLVRLTHGWTGVILAVFIFLVAGSGAILAFMSEMFLAQYGEILEAVAPAPDESYVPVDTMFAAAQAARGEHFRPVGVLMPHTRLPKVSTALVFGMEPDAKPSDYFMLVSVDPRTGRAKGSFWLGDAFGHDVIDFHYALVMGNIGATFVSVLGILLTLFALSGLWLWWPRQAGLWRKAHSPSLKGATGSTLLYRLHGWIGVWTALLVILFALSGTATIRPQWFGPMIGDLHVHEPHGGAWSRQCDGKTSLEGAANQARQHFPGKKVSTIFIEPGEPIHVFLRGAGDLNAIEGDSMVWVHPTCDGVIKAVDAAQFSVPERLRGMMLSLHAGYVFGPILGSILVVATGLSLVFFSISGVIVFFTRTWRRRYQTI